MKTADLVQRLSKGIASAIRSQHFCVEDIRSHLISMISRHQCDVTHKLEKTGSPYALVFTKTDGSFNRRAQRFAADQKLLDTVNELLGGQSKQLWLRVDDCCANFVRHPCTAAAISRHVRGSRYRVELLCSEISR